MDRVIRTKFFIKEEKAPKGTFKSKICNCFDIVNRYLKIDSPAKMSELLSFLFMSD